MTLRSEPDSGTVVIPTRHLTRRRFMNGVGATLTAAGLDACGRPPPEDIVPYVTRPPEVVPGVPSFYATTASRGGYGVGMLVESHEGRPTKIEGHPMHPMSLGRTLLHEQAEVLALYDPDRAKYLRHGTDPQAYSAFVSAFSPSSPSNVLDPTGRGVALLLQPTSSPLVDSLLGALRRRYPECSIFFEPSSAPLARWNACQALFGRALDETFDLTRADVAVDLDANFLFDEPASIRWAHDFAKARRIERPSDALSRLYVVESAVSVTGASADERLAVPSSQVGRIALALLVRIAAKAAPDADRVRAALPEHSLPRLDAREGAWVDALAVDLLAHPGRSAVIVGDRQSAVVHAIGIALNHLLGNLDNVVGFVEPALLDAGGSEYSIHQLIEELAARRVRQLFVLGGNPSYTLPGDLGWRKALQGAAERVVLSRYENETAEDATWFIPEAHWLESWGDLRALDGTVSLRQPLVRPLYGGISVEQVLATIAGNIDTAPRRLLRDLWIKELGGDAEFEACVQSGIVPDRARVVQRPSPDWNRLRALISELAIEARPAQIELDVLPDPRILDGRHANNGWLMELPEPVTKLVWDNAALIAPETASELGIEQGDVIEIRDGEQRVELPALPVPGQALHTVAVWLGYGRQGAEATARGVGVDVSPLRHAASPFVTRGVKLHKTGAKQSLVITQEDFDSHDREIVLYRTRDDWTRTPEFARAHNENPPTLMPDFSRPPQWGMVIDLNRCTGCSTCVIACEVENNGPVVGKDMVAMGRQMQWLRIDTYYVAEHAGRRRIMQPMLCQQCEKAPCEYVCPVHATAHSPDGLNEMVYNRCVGTRFCSNNCPYKVRRFNWFDFNQDMPESLKLVKNPDVTVRARGVMEKCTYCVQRIRRAEIDAKLKGEPLAKIEFTTACAQACPTDAIAFGLISEPSSRVSADRKSLRAYGVLNEIGAQPRTRYLARITNPNPEVRG